MLHPLQETSDEDDNATQSQPAKVDIIFFHGLQFDRDGLKTAYYNTWTTTGDICWPSDWLGEDFGEDARVMSVSYEANATKFTGHGNNPVELTGKRVMQDLLFRLATMASSFRTLKHGIKVRLKHFWVMKQFHC